MISKEVKAQLTAEYGLLDYIKENDVEEYRALIEKLGIRK